MKNILFCFLSLLSSQLFAAEKPKEDMSAVIEMMIFAKATGMCSVFSQMVNFQQATKMPGGDEFIVRFINTEAARLGQTLESFVAQCPKTVEKYDSNMKMLGYEQ